MVRFVKCFLIAVVVSVFCPGFTALADVKLPAIVGDSMVLQQQAEVNIWGWADASEEITVTPSWSGEKYNCVTGSDGKWTVKVKTPQAGGPYTLKIAGKNRFILDNILIGEVWVCSGQSNMQWTLSRSDGGEEEIAAANYPDIRLFTVSRRFNRAPQQDCQGRWTLCSPEMVKEFSAVGYFYGLELYKELGVPIGLISSNWGGTVAEAWTSGETLKTLPDFAQEVAEIQSVDPKKAGSIYSKRMAKWKKEFYALDEGMNEKWFKPGFDSSSWQTIETPQKWNFVKELTNFDGLVWFCRDFEVDAGMVSTDKGFTLELGAIDDMDITWVNGQKVGGIEEEGFSNVPRKYDVPAGCIKAGKNTVTVRVHDYLYQGGFLGTADQLKLTPVDEGAGAPIALAGTWRYKITVNQREIPSPPKQFHNNAPTALYNGMIEPIKSFGIAGAIWYQGESNRERAYQYRTLFPAMIKDWRTKWAQGDFPFYYVQIAPYNYGPGTAAAELREAQLMTLSVPNVGMAVTMDIGDPNDIHPTNKTDVGFRLALCALAETYGNDDVAYLLPVYKSMEVQGDKIVLSFDNTYGGLYALNGPLANFAIAAADKKFVPAQALIDGEKIVVSSSEVKNPVAVRFAWESADESNLFNLADLSSSSFRTDSWPGDTIDNK